MGRAESPDTLRAAEADELQLAVVHGPRAGARHPLHAGRELRVGHGIGNDIVIRHPSARGHRARVRVEPHGVRLLVDEGTVKLFGVDLGPGQEVLLPVLVPFALGESMVAVGPAHGSGWSECRRLARRLAATPSASSVAVPPGATGDTAGADGAADGASAAAGPASALAARWRTLGGSAQRRLPGWWRVPVALVAILLVPLVIALVLSRPPIEAAGRGARPEQVEALRRMLDAEGFDRLTVQPIQGGAPVVRGMVETDAERARLAAVLARSARGTGVEVASGEQLARMVSDVFRLNGVRAEVRHAGRGLVEASVADTEPALLQRVEGDVRRDVPGLSALKVEIVGEPRRRPPSAPVRDDPRKRVVSVVYGPNGYVVTTDGARYFAGAILPTGHRIDRITSQEVVLERDGELTRLVL